MERVDTTKNGFNCFLFSYRVIEHRIVLTMVKTPFLGVRDIKQLLYKFISAIGLFNFLGNYWKH